MDGGAKEFCGFHELFQDISMSKYVNMIQKRPEWFQNALFPITFPITFPKDRFLDRFLSTRTCRIQDLGVSGLLMTVEAPLCHNRIELLIGQGMSFPGFKDSDIFRPSSDSSAKFPPITCWFMLYLFPLAGCRHYSITTSQALPAWPWSPLWWGSNECLKCSENKCLVHTPADFCTCLMQIATNEY